MTEDEIRIEVWKKVFKEVWGNPINLIDANGMIKQMYADEMKKRAEAEFSDEVFKIEFSKEKDAERFVNNFLKTLSAADKEG